jgi:hypothetical protein
LPGYKYSLLTILFNPKPFTFSYRCCTIFFFIHLGFPLVIFPMADVDAINQGDVTTAENMVAAAHVGVRISPNHLLL